MEKFIKFQNPVTIKQLQRSLSDPRIILLRKSQTTNTIQIRVLKDMSNREIINAFSPHRIKKIFNEFPYPLRNAKLAFVNLTNVKNIFRKLLSFPKSWSLIFLHQLINFSAPQYLHFSDCHCTFLIWKTSPIHRCLIKWTHVIITSDINPNNEMVI